MRTKEQYQFLAFCGLGHFLAAVTLIFCYSKGVQTQEWKFAYFLSSFFQFNSEISKLLNMNFVLSHNPKLLLDSSDKHRGCRKHLIDI